MSSGFFALLDDIATIAKVAAASLDDTAAQAVKIGAKSAGIVIDDAAVTPRYVVGFAAKRELPIIAKIAWGSLRNKLLYLLPAALVLSFFAPWAITPLLMTGGAYLCFEGWEKIHELLHPTNSDAEENHIIATSGAASEAAVLAREEAQVAGAIRTDLILSAEIMAISLAAIELPGFWAKAGVLALVGALVTAGVYGAVALIVKADDFGVWLAREGKLAATRAFGSQLVLAMPKILAVLSGVGTAAMLWVGGGIILHGLEAFGLEAIPHAVADGAAVVGSVFGPADRVVAWLVDATIAGVFGVAVGWGVAWVGGHVDRLAISPPARGA